MPITAFRFIFCLHNDYNECYRNTAKYADWMRRLQEYMVMHRNFDIQPYNWQDKNAGIEEEIVEEGIADLNVFLQNDMPFGNMID